MPDTLEVLIGGGCLHAAERGAESKYFDEHGDCDDVPTLPFSFINTGGKFFDNGSSI